MLGRAPSGDGLWRSRGLWWLKRGPGSRRAACIGGAFLGWRLTTGTRHTDRWDVRFTRFRNGPDTARGGPGNGTASRARFGRGQLRGTLSTRLVELFGMLSRSSLVVSHRPPPGAGSTVRSRPWVPWKCTVCEPTDVPLIWSW
ncbi:hypothetical protein B0I31_110211 [Saccharothrix carnea]|uniref:Uncharacterized protein n=1 Tax=Saccharothrix carnea TaxID=1280637 RepID=A0A2P8I3S9_SACCR|nr:hypothetical protein B0I31_110211 [Saccharothrix carnea]